MGQDQLLDPVDAARRVGLTTAGLAAHDEVLQPIRTSSGRRIYRADRVEAFARIREQRRQGGEP